MRDGMLFRTYCLPLQCPVLAAVLPHDVAQVPARGGRVRAADQHRQAGVAAAGVRPRPSRARDHSVAGNLPTSRQAGRREGERTGFVSAVVCAAFSAFIMCSRCCSSGMCGLSRVHAFFGLAVSACIMSPRRLAATRRSVGSLALKRGLCPLGRTEKLGRSMLCLVLSYLEDARLVRWLFSCFQRARRIWKRGAPNSLFVPSLLCRTKTA